MLLARKFDDPMLNLSLEVFLRETNELLAGQLISVILFGSVAFDDLAPSYGDLDFVAVVRDDMDEAMLQRLIELRKPLRNDDYGIYCSMIEGPFLPYRMLDPGEPGNTICWGTRGERRWDRNRLGWFVHQVIHECGIVIWGEDIRHKFPGPTSEQLFEEISGIPDALRNHNLDGDLHSIDWLLLVARTLLWLREGRLTSKSLAADWACMHASGAWKEFLPQAKELRKNPSLVESCDVKSWLTTLSKPIQEAREELEQEIARGNGRMRG